MKKVALICENSPVRGEFIKSLLCDECEFLVWQSVEEVRKNLPREFDDLEVLIIDHPSGNKNTPELLSRIAARNNYLFTLPVLILTDPEAMKEDEAYLEAPVVAIISTADTPKVVRSRIENAIRFCNSTTFEKFSGMLEVLPALIYLKDARGRYAFCSQHWHHLEKDYKSVRGKTDLDIRKDKDNARIAMASDIEVLQSGVGKNYVIREEDDVSTDYLKIIKEPLKDKEGNVTGIIALVNNVTEEELLRQELRRKSITDELTGLLNRCYFDELAAEKRDEMSYPLTVISADCDNLKFINDEFGHAAGDQYICYARDALLESLPEGSYVFRMGGDEFLAIVPGANEVEAEYIMKKIEAAVEGKHNDRFGLKLSVGKHTMMKQGESLETAINISDREMYRAKRLHRQQYQKA